MSLKMVVAQGAHGRRKCMLVCTDGTQAPVPSHEHWARGLTVSTQQALHGACTWLYERKGRTVNIIA